MKLLSKENGENWIRGHNLPLAGREIRRFFKHSYVYERTQRTHSESFLAKHLVKYFADNKNESALWIEAWNMLSTDNMSLYYGYLKSLGEKRKLQEASLFIFNKADLESIESLLDLALFFVWDTYLIAPKRKMVISPNDEFIHCTFDREIDANHFRELFKNMKFKEETKYFSKLPKMD